MRKVFDKLHHHGKKVYRHAKKHHKKYLWGAAGFFGLFKLFSFIIVSLGGYLTTNAGLTQAVYIHIPAQIIHQANKEILKFDIGDIDINDIRDISFQMEVDTENNAIDSYISTENNLYEKYVYTLYKGGGKLRTMQPKDIQIFKDQLITGNIIIYMEVPYIFSKTNREIGLEIGVDSVLQEIDIQPTDTQSIYSPQKDLSNSSETKINIFGLNGLEGIVSDEQIIQNLYGVWSTYTNNRNKKICKTSEMAVIHTSPGKNTLPESLVGNAIYVLSSGDYITDYMIDIQSGCTAIISAGTPANLFTSTTRGANIKISTGNNIIIDNLNLYGEDDGNGGMHTGNNYGIFLDTSNNTISKINTYHHIGFGVYMENFNNDISEIKLYKKESISLNPKYDTYINADKKNKNYGKSDVLMADSKGSKILIKFDLWDIPSGAKITDAAIRLVKVGGTSNTIKIKKILNNPRTEGDTDGGTPLYGEPNYEYISYPDIPWYGGIGLIAGIDYGSQDLTNSISFGKKRNIVNSGKRFDFNAYGIQSLQEYIDNPGLNQGFVFINGDSSIDITSKEDGNIHRKPQLTIQYDYEDIHSKNTPVSFPTSKNIETVKQIMLINGYTETGSKLVGSKPIDTSLSQGNVPISITMESIDGQTSVDLLKDTKVKKQDGGNYTGIIVGPKELPLSSIQSGASNQEPIEAFKVGSDSQSLLLEDADGNDVYATIKVATPDLSIGKTTNIYYSEDGLSWNFLTTARITGTANNAFVTFQTNHFTTFMLYGTRDFYIDSDNPTVADPNNATLYNNTDPEQVKSMRFGNSERERDSAQRETISNTKNGRILAEGEGIKTVYAEFCSKDGSVGTSNPCDGDSAYVTDNIIYNKDGPTTMINSPSSNSRQGSSFGMNITDTDAAGLQECYYIVTNNGSSGAPTNRTCNSTTNITECITEGTNICSIEAYSVDIGSLTSSSIINNISIDFNPPSAPSLTCSTFTDNVASTFAGSTTCSIDDTAGPSAKTAVAYSLNNGAWIDNSNATQYQFVPNIGTTVVKFRISDFGGGPTESNTFTIIKQSAAAPDAPTLTCGNFTHDTRSNYGGSITCSINDTATPTRTAVEYSTNSGVDRVDNGNSLNYNFTPSEGTTNLILRISSEGGTTDSNTYIIKKDATIPVAPALTCGDFTHNARGTYVGSIACAINDTSGPSPKTVQFSTDNGQSRIDNNGSLIYNFTPLDGETSVIAKISDVGGESSNSNTYIIMKDSVAPDTPSLTCSNFTHNVWTEFAGDTLCNINDTATRSPRTEVRYTIDGGNNRTNNNNNLGLTFTPDTGQNDIIFKISDFGGGPTYSNTYTILKGSPYAILPSSSNISEHINALTGMGYVAGSGRLEGVRVGESSINFANTNAGLIAPAIAMQSTQFNNSAVIIKIPEGTYFEGTNQEAFTGVFVGPTVQNLSVAANIADQFIKAVVEIGSGTVNFKTSTGADVYAEVRIPLTGVNIGDTATINYSSDNGATWNYLTGATVTGTQESLYVTFLTNHCTSFSVGIGTWDNDNFLNSGFWNLGPSTGNIIRALYGGGSGSSERTAYTSGRSEVSCVTGSMTVSYVTGGGIPATLNINTIYVVSSGSTVGITPRVLADCSAIVGSGTVRLERNRAGASAFMRALSKKNIIIDNVIINSTGYGDVSLNFTGGSSNNTFNNITGYGSTGNFLNFFSGSYNFIYNSDIRNNSGWGIYFDAGSTSGSINTSRIQDNNSGGIIFNISSYGKVNSGTFAGGNVSTYGIYISGSNYIAIVGTNIYSNTSDGIHFDFSSLSGTITNTDSYLNGGDGIEISGGSNFARLTNTNLYSNTNIGLQINGSYINIIQNMQSYKNGTGITVINSSGNIFFDSQIYNNTNKGILFKNDSLSTLNNMNIFNNTGIGAYLDNAVSGFVLNNSLIYNNNDYGIYINTGTINNVFNNSMIYNNKLDGIYIKDSSTTKGYFHDAYIYNNSGYGVNFSPGGQSVFEFYGTLRLFTNINGSFSGTNGDDSVLRKHIASSNPLWSAGSLNTGTASMNCMYVSNPRDTGGTWLLTNASCDTKGRIAWNPTQPVSYLYGGYVNLQQRPVYYNSSSGLIDRDSISLDDFTHFAGAGGFNTEMRTLDSPSIAVDGNPDPFTFIDNYAALKNTYYTSNIITLTGIQTGISAPIAIDTGVLYKNGVNVGTYTTGKNGDTFYVGLTGSSSDESNISSTMTIGKRSDTYLIRTNNPITIKYYGVGSIYKTGRCIDSCDLSVMKVETITPSTINAFMAGSGFDVENRVFVLSSGNYILTGNYYLETPPGTGTTGPYGLILTKSCTAIIGTGGTGAVTFYSDAQKEGIIGIAIGRSNIIIDNIKIDGYNNGLGSTHTKNNNGIVTIADNSSNSIFNSEVYNELEGDMGNRGLTQGIYMRNTSSCFTINNVKIYSGGGGIRIENGIRHVINNIQIFNHYRNGIYLGGSDNAINNYASYANNRGLEINGSDNILNNALINRTNDGIFLMDGSRDNKFNNIKFNSNYANGSAYGINAEYAATCLGNQYYGSISMNQTDASLRNTNGNDAVLSAGTGGFMGRTTGALTSTSAMSWSYFINPYDGNNAYLFDWNTIGAFNQDFTYSWTGKQSVIYSYGGNTLLQAQPVWYNRSTSSRTNILTYDSTKFIGGDTTKISGSMAINGGYYVTGRNLTIVFTSAVAAEYRLLGNITGLNRTGTITAGGSVTTGVVLSGIDGIRSVIVQLYTGGTTGIYRATHYADEVTMDVTPPTVGTGYISSGATGFKSPTYYFKGTIDISGSVSDASGLSTGSCEFTTGSTWVTALYSGSSTTGYCYKTGLTYTASINIRFRIQDSLGTLGTGGTGAYTYDATIPVVGTGFINSGSTGNNGTTLYYKGTINISGNVSDAGVGLSTGSCEFTTGSTWVTALYSGSSTTGYCYKTGLTYTTGINIRFRIQDMLGNINTGNTGIYLYDATPPPIVTLLSPASGSTIYYFPSTNLLRSGSIDTGVGTSGYTYQVSTGATFTVYYTSGTTTTTGTVLSNLPNNRTYYWRVRAFDKLTNSGSWSTGNFTVTPDPYVTYYFGIGGGTQFTAGWNTNGCNGVLSIISVYYIPAGYNTGILSSPMPNTIYVLADGVHTIDATPITFGGDCGALVGSGMGTSIGNVTIYSSGQIADSMIKNQARNNNIIDNIILDGEYGTGSSGSPHGRNYNGIEFWDGQSSSIYNTKIRYFGNNGIKFTSNQTYTTINSADAFNNNDNGIYLSGSDYNTISVSNTYNNAEGVKFIGSDNNTINNHTSYSNGVDGIYFYGTSTYNNINNSSTYSNNRDGIRIETNSDNNTISGSQSRGNTNNGIFIYDYSDYNKVFNSQISSNTQVGIQIEQYSTYNTISGSQVHDNSSNGIMLVGYADYNTIEDTQTHYNNDGVHISSSSKHNIINNTQAFWNNSAGIYIYNSSDYNTINNSQTYNNNGDGIGFENSVFGVVNNAKSYLNGSDGLSVTSSSDYIYTNNFGSIENSNCINAAGAGNNNLYFGEFTGTNCIVPTPQFAQGTSTPGAVARANGNRTSVSIRTWSNPYYDSFCDEITYSADASRNRSQTSEYCKDTSRPGASPGAIEGFLYGSLLPRQADPTYYDSSNVLQNLGSSYNSLLAIAEFDALDGVPNSYSFTPLAGAATGTYYTSDIVSIAGLGANVRNRFFTDSGTLYKNTVNVGTFATGANGDDIYMELMSSASINDLVTGNMKVGSYLSPYTILTTGAADTTPPNVGLPYINAGITGDNGGILYYKGTGDIRADVSDNIALDTSSCQYTIDNGGSRSPASSYVGGPTLGYCEAAGLTPYADIQIMFSMQDMATNITTGAVETYIYDGTAPSSVSTVSPTNGGYITASSTTLTWTISADAGIGMSGYIYEVNSGGILIASGTVSSSSDWIGSLTDGITYDWRVLAFDKFDNQTAWSSVSNFTVDMTSPTVGLPYISAGTTGTDGSSIFYRGTIDIRADITDNIGLGGTCEYSIDNGAGRNGGSYVAISPTAGYCQAVGLIPNTDIEIKFRTSDLAGNPGVSSMQQYIYDGTAPTVSPGYISLGSTGDNGGTLYYKGTIDIRADVVDAKALSGTSCMYTIDGATRIPAAYTSTAGYTVGYCEVTGLTPGANIDISFSIQDTVQNITTGSAGTYLYDNTPPSAIATTAPTSGLVTSLTTVNLQRMSSYDAGVGLDGYIYEVSTGAGFTTFIITGTIPTNSMSVGPLANNTTYYWRALAFDKLGNQTARSDIPNFTVDLTPPTVGTGYISTGTTGVDYGGNLYYKGTITISGSVSDNVGFLPGSCQYTTDGINWTPATYVGSSTTGYCYASVTPATGIQVSFRIQDNAGFSMQGNAGIYFYDATPPTIGTGYISAGTTGINGSTGYYKGTITISGSINDTGSLNVTSCQYTTGVTRAPASFGGTTKTGYCYVAGLTPTATINIRFSAQDIMSNITTGATGMYVYDNTGPPQVTTTSPTNGQTIGSGTVSLVRGTVIDTGVGTSGYIYQVSTGNTFTTFITSGSISTTGTTITGLANGTTYYRRVYAFDIFGNTGAWSATGNFIVNIDTVAPTMIFTGVTPADGATIYINNFTAQVDFTELNLNEFKRSRSGTTYSVYDSGLVLIYNFDNLTALGESTGLAKDRSQYGYDGANTGVGGGAGPTWTSTGKWNGAYQFDGSNDKTSSSTILGSAFNVSSATSGNITASVRMKRGGKAGTINIFMDRYGGGCGAGCGYGFELYMDASSKLVLGGRHGAGTSYTRITTTASVTIGQWYFVTYVHSGNNRLLYIDGTYYSGDSPGISRSDLFDYPLELGTEATATTYSFSGTLDEPRIYNRALTSGEIRQLYNSNLAKYDTGKWLYTSPQTGMTIGTYRYTGYASDIVGNSVTTGRSITYGIGITGLMFIPTLNITYFSGYTFAATISGNITTGSVDLLGINGDGGNCIDYYASGSCVDTGGISLSTFPLVYSGSNVWIKTGIMPDDVYPEIVFADKSITWNNAPLDSTLTRNNYSILHLNNPYIMTGNTSFWIEINTMTGSTNTNVVDLQVYLVQSGKNLSFFSGSDWRTKTGIQLVGTITRTSTVNHTHTAYSAHHLISLMTNSNGTIGANNININGDFWIVLYSDTPTASRGRKLRYQPSNLCTNSSGWYLGNQGAGRTTTWQSGCVDSHIHVARQVTSMDGIKATINAYYTGGVITGTKTFNFGTGNLAPNPTSFMTPVVSGTYKGNVYISRYPANDANLDALTYNVSLVDSGGTVLQLLTGGISTTGFTWNSATVADGTYSLSGSVCDPYNPCTPFYLNNTFVIDNTVPILIFTGATPASGATITGNNFKPQIQITETGVGLYQFIYTFNTIPYSYYDSGLVLMMNFDKVAALGETDGNILDLSQYGNVGSGYGGITWTGNGMRNGAYIFNGSNSYVSVPSNDAFGFGTGNFAISFRIKWANTGGFQSFIDGGYGVNKGILIESDGAGKKVRVYIGSTLATSGDWNFTTNTWYYFVTTRTGSSLSIFIDGNQIGNSSSNSTSVVKNDYLIGKYSGGEFFNGFMDELRFYNRTLSSGEILQMRRSNLAKYDTGKWLFTDDRQCMINGTYTYTGYASDLLASSSTTGRINTVNIANRDWTNPTYYLGSTGYSSSIRTLSGQYTGYYTIIDWKGTSGRYSTFQLPTRLTGTTYTGNYIDGSNIYLMATGLDVIAGSINSSIYVTGGLSTYQSASAPLQYIVRNYVPSQYSCPSGIYGNKPYVKVDIPANQVPDIYSGTLNIILYE